MNSIETWTTFFGWCTVVNIGIYVLSVTMLSLMRNFAYGMQAKVFAVSVEDAARVSISYVGAYKLLITVFCFTPWLALTLMS